MLRLILLIFLTIFIFPFDCRNISIDIQNPSSCMNNTYKIPLYATRSLRMTFNQTLFKEQNIHTIRIQTLIADQKVAYIEDHFHTIKKVFHLMNNTKQYNDKSIIVYDLNIRTTYIDQTYIHYFIETINMKDHIRRINCSIFIMITQPQRLRDKIFYKAVPFIIMFISVQMGILLDTEVLKELIRRPIPALIGFIGQYGLMPLIAFAISKCFQYQPLYGLGLFVVGCCPGAAGSNQWTIIFDGDLNLSAFMSFASIAASFFMMPFWLYTLGQNAYLHQLKIHILFFNLGISLLTIVGPLVLGMLIAYFIPKLKPFIKRIVKPMLILLMIYFYILGAYVNYYQLRYIELRTILTAPLLPWSGFLLGGLFAWICRQDYKRIITIGIETGIQNIGIAFMILLNSFPPPINIYASSIPLIVAYLSTTPFYLILIYQFIHRKLSKPKLPIQNISTETLSKIVRRLSEEEQPLDNPPPQKRKTSLPTSVLDPSADSRPPEIL